MRVGSQSRFQALLPFAIVGAEDEIEIEGQLVRARIYPWGIVEVDNSRHSDFSRLRSALLKYVSCFVSAPFSLLTCRLLART